MLALLAAMEVTGSRAQQTGVTKSDEGAAGDRVPAGDRAQTAEVSTGGSRDAVTTGLVAIGAGIVGVVIGLGVGRRRRSRTDRVLLTG